MRKTEPKNGNRLVIINELPIIYLHGYIPGNKAFGKMRETFFVNQFVATEP